MKTFYKIIFGIFGILLLAGCQELPFFSKYDSTDSGGWQARDTLVYDLPEVDVASTFDVKVATRIAQDYKYNNLVFVVRLYEGKHIVSTDNVSYDIYDENGEHKGSGFPFVEHEKELNHQVKLFPHKKYRIEITHIMRLDPLPGVCDVGIEMKSEK